MMMKRILDDPGNQPEAFDALLPAEQAALRLWVRLALKPAEDFDAEDGRWHSYNLKHHAELALGWYVSNGEMKGAMLAEGYRHRAEPRSPNWRFACRRRCPHRMGTVWVGRTESSAEWAFTCPAALRVDSLYRIPSRGSVIAEIVTGTYPALCVATEEEFSLFERLRHIAAEEQDRRREALKAG